MHFITGSNQSHSICQRQTGQVSKKVPLACPPVILKHVSLPCALLHGGTSGEISHSYYQRTRVTKVTLSSLANTCFDVSHMGYGQLPYRRHALRSQGSLQTVPSLRGSDTEDSMHQQRCSDIGGKNLIKCMRSTCHITNLL